MEYTIFGETPIGATPRGAWPKYSIVGGIRPKHVEPERHGSDWKGPKDVWDSRKLVTKAEERASELKYKLFAEDDELIELAAAIVTSGVLDK